jgi:hypothetical protein
MAGRFRAFGSSMEPVIPSGSRVTVEPVDVEEIELGDVVMTKVNGSTTLHLVKAIDTDRRLVEISGTRLDTVRTCLRDLHSYRGVTGSWCPRQDQALGRVDDVELRPAAPAQRRRRDRGEEDVGEDQHQTRGSGDHERVGCADPSVEQCDQYGLPHPETSRGVNRQQAGEPGDGERAHI